MNRITTMLILTLMCVLVEATFKWFTFKSPAIFFDLGPKLCLWATGAIFSLALTDKIVMTDQIMKYISRMDNNREDYEILSMMIGGELCQRFNNIFWCNMLIWILSLIISAYALLDYNTLGGLYGETGSMLALSIALGIMTTVSALLAAKEEA